VVKGLAALLVYVAALRVLAPPELVEGRRTFRAVFHRSKPA